MHLARGPHHRNWSWLQVTEIRDFALQVAEFGILLRVERKHRLVGMLASPFNLRGTLALEGLVEHHVLIRRHSASVLARPADATPVAFVLALLVSVPGKATTPRL